MLKSAPALLLLSLLAGCATEGFYVKVMKPAPVNLGQYDLIAIDRFSGEGSEYLEEEFTDALRGAVNPMTGQADFNVIDRRELDSMLDDLRKNPGDGMDRRTMDVLERWKNAEVVITADVHVHHVVEEMQEQPFFNQKTGEQYTTYTRHVSAQVSAIVEVKESEHAPAFDTVQLEDVASVATRAKDAEPDAVDYEALLATARQKVINQYLLRVFPHEVSVMVNLFTDGDLPGLQVGNGYARTGDWDAALEAYTEASEMAIGELAAVRYKALYNMGVAYEYTNQFDAAKQALKDSYALEQDSMILSELQNVSARENEYRRLMEQSSQAATPQQ